MSLNSSKILFYSLILVLVTITTVALPEVQAVDAEETTGKLVVQTPSIVIQNNYSGVLGTLNDSNLSTLQKIQQQESQKIKDELERRRLEEERKQREAEEAARLAALQSSQRVASSSVPGRVYGDFETAIRNSCAAYGCNSDQVIRVMYCESGGRSNAVNGIHKGLFQFNPNTFAANSKRVGTPNADIWNPYDQINVTTWMFANGQAWQWSCK